MSGSIDSSGCAWQRGGMELSPETTKLIEQTQPAIERALMGALATEPDAPVCMGVAVSDGKLGTGYRATLRSHRRALAPPADVQPQRALWEAVGVALERPTTAGAEYVVVVEQRSDGSVVTSCTTMLTDVRAKVRSVLPGPKTPADRYAAYAAHVLSSETTDSEVESLADCASLADTGVKGFDMAMRDVRDGTATAIAVPVVPLGEGKEMLRWWNDLSGRPVAALRQRLLLILLLRAGLYEDARWLHRLAETMRQLVVPEATSAQNVEVIGMSAAVLNEAMLGAPPEHESDADPGGDELRRYGSDIWHHLWPDSMEKGLHGAGLLPVPLKQGFWFDMRRFLSLWRSSAFARLEVSHKLAAALCFTDIPETEEVRAPWQAWSLLVPDGLLGDSPIARIWCIGSEPTLFVKRPGGMVEMWSAENVGGAVAAEMLRALVRSVCVVLTDPDRRKAAGSWGRSGSSPARGRRPHGPPQEGARYLLAQPVTIDLRDTVREALTGRRGGGGIPKHQFLVRGHPRQQAWGPQHTLRRYKWIEPYWKGDPDARILLRGHRMQEGEEPEKKPTLE